MQQETVPTFLLGGGEMGARMREKDWSGTALGPARPADALPEIVVADTGIVESPGEGRGATFAIRLPLALDLAAALPFSAPAC